MLRCTLHRNTHSRAVGGSVETPRAILAGLYELFNGDSIAYYFEEGKRKPDFHPIYRQKLTIYPHFAKIRAGSGLLPTTAGGLAHTTRKGGDLMPLTITFHIFGYVVTIRVKCENRHSAK